MNEAIISLIVMMLLAITTVISLLKLKKDQDSARKIIAWVWIILGTVPLQSAVINQVFEEDTSLIPVIIFGIFAVPIIIPAILLKKQVGKGLSFILSYAWIGISVFGVIFLFFAIGIPVLFIKAVTGQSPFEVFFLCVLIVLWTGAGVLIFSATIKVLKTIQFIKKNTNLS